MPNIFAVKFLKIQRSSYLISVHLLKNLRWNGTDILTPRK